MKSPPVTLAGFAGVVTTPSILALLWLLALLNIFRIAVKLPQRAGHWDFSIYYMSVRLLHDGHNPYTTNFEPGARELGLEAGDIRHATDPPPFLLLMEPFAMLSERTGFYVWIGLNIVFFGAAFVMLAGSSGLDRRAVLALAALAMLYPPLEWHFLAAQSKIVILLLLVLMVRLMQRGANRAAGLCLALAGLIRAFPVLLIVYLALQRRWQALIWTFIGLAVGGMITLLLIGPAVVFSFTHGVAFATGRRWLSVPANISLAGAVSRLLWHVPHSGSVRLLCVGTADIILLAFTIAATLRLEPAEDPEWRAFSLWVVASVLLSPTAWTYYMVLFLIPFMQMAGAVGRGTVSRRAVRAAVASYIVMTLTTLAVLSMPVLLAGRIGAVRTERYMWGAAEGWFVSAFLAYCAAYWFSVDGWRRSGAAIREIAA